VVRGKASSDGAIPLSAGDVKDAVNLMDRVVATLKHQLRGLRLLMPSEELWPVLRCDNDGVASADSGTAQPNRSFRELFLLLAEDLVGCC
jgi:hypothetical protein